MRPSPLFRMRTPRGPDRPASVAAGVARIQDARQELADDVERDDRDRQRRGGKDEQQRMAVEVLEALVDHLAPARMRRLDTDADEAQRGFREHEGADVERRANDQEG